MVVSAVAANGNITFEQQSEALERTFNGQRAPEGGLTADGLILTMQLRAVPRARLYHLLGTLSANVLADVDHALRITLDLEEC